MSSASLLKKEKDTDMYMYIYKFNITITTYNFTITNKAIWKQIIYDLKNNKQSWLINLLHCITANWNETAIF